MKKKIVCTLLAFLLAVSYMPTCSSTASGFIDVPSGHWAEEYIVRASQLGIMQGTGDAKFGLGASLTRAQFAAMLTRLFDWERVSPEIPAVPDNTDLSAWYYADIETLAARGVTAEAEAFRPNEKITRAELASMLVRALGYGTLAENASGFATDFTDITSDIQGYVTLASDFGLITGIDETTFNPKGTALREQAAAMMIRLYDRYMNTESWNHAFYAIASYPQRDIIASLDGVSFGWSRLQYSMDGGVLLNTTNAGGNEFNIPSAANEPVAIAAQNNTPRNLSVFMSTAQTVELPSGEKSNACAEILSNAENRTEAIRQIIAAVNNPELSFTGVTIDFEELRNNLAQGLTEFMSELKTELGGRDLYICVHPKMRGSYYDGYDFRALGEICDKVIVMAHDYQAKSLTPQLMAQGFTTTPVTPFEDVYYALKAVTDKHTGIEDSSKIALAISIGSVGWSLRDGSVINASGMRPVPEDIIKRLNKPDTVINYSERYRNPYITYYDETDDTDNIVWYEDTRSIGDKIALARMFGITGISYWRLGLLPDYYDGGEREIYYDVTGLIK